MRVLTRAESSPNFKEHASSPSTSSTSSSSTSSSNSPQPVTPDSATRPSHQSSPPPPPLPDPTTTSNFSSSGLKLYSASNKKSPPPQLAIRATRAYRAQQILEISFQIGDFFHAIGQRTDPSSGQIWYEATNPSTGSRGLVPASYFEKFGRSQNHHQSLIPISSLLIGDLDHHHQTSNQKPPSSSSPPQLSNLNTHHIRKPITPSSPVSMLDPSGQRNTLFATVKHDFAAERTDELDAKKGESLIVMAHSNGEWLIVKALGRLGEPGLIPLAFVEVKDASTGTYLSQAHLLDLILHQRIIPTVEEWKQAAAAVAKAHDRNSFSTSFDSAWAPPPPPHKRSINHTKLPTRTIQSLRTSKSYVQIPTPFRLSKTYDQEGSPPPPTPTTMTTSQNVALPRTRTMSSYQTIEKSLPQLPRPVHALSITPRSTQSMSFPSSSHHRAGSSDGHWASDRIHRPMLSYLADSDPEAELGEEEDVIFETLARLSARYGQLVHAVVEGFHDEPGHRWYHVRTHFRTRPSRETRAKTTILVLYRLESQLTDFHNALLDAFPLQAGRTALNSMRMIPDLPSSGAKEKDLSEYLSKICSLPMNIRNCELIYEFFGPRDGDVEIDEEDEELVDPVLQQPLSALNPVSPNPILHRIKLYQPDEKDVIAIGVRAGTDYRQLLAKVEERVSFGDQTRLSTPMTVKMGEDEWMCLMNDEDVNRWFNLSKGRLILRYDFAKV